MPAKWFVMGGGVTGDALDGVIRIASGIVARRHKK
jgi:hypothetical protein